MLYIIILFVFLIFIFIFKFVSKQMNECFYKSELFPELLHIKKYEEEIIKEFHILENKKDFWIDWPETELYENQQWQVLPFYAFGKWSKKNCKLMPNLTNFLKSIPNLKIASLSKLGPNTKLEPHKGWGDYSNNVIRCHYGLKIPSNKCYVYVKHDNNTTYEKRNHKYKEWIIFDDSKDHYAYNKSKYERIVLIIDIKRPSFFKKGTSNVQYSKELINLINEFKKSL